MVALRSDIPAVVEVAPLEVQIRQAAAEFQRADAEAREAESSSLAARAAAHEARAAANAKLHELGLLLARAKKAQAAQDWEGYLSSLGIEHAQLAFEYLGEKPEPQTDAPPAPTRGRPLRIDDDVMAIKIAMSCESEALARYAEARQVKDPQQQRQKVNAAREQLVMARRNLDEVLGAHVLERHGSGRDFDANRAKLRDLYHERSEAKLCVKCGAPALPGQVRCHVHRQDLAEQQQRRKEEGL